MLAAVAGMIAPILKPLGMGDWRISTALISGFLAKESVVSTLECTVRFSCCSACLPGSGRCCGHPCVLPAVYTVCCGHCGNPSGVRRKTGSADCTDAVCHCLGLCLCCSYAVCSVLNISIADPDPYGRDHFLLDRFFHLTMHFTYLMMYKY